MGRTASFSAKDGPHSLIRGDSLRRRSSRVVCRSAEARRPRRAPPRARRLESSVNALRSRAAAGGRAGRQVARVLRGRANALELSQQERQRSLDHCV